jgi:hypothetical protein
LQKSGSGDDCRSFNRVLQQRTPECSIMSLLESVASLRPTKKVITTGLVTFCLLWADAPMPSRADTSPSQTAGVPIPDGQIDKAIASLDMMGATQVVAWIDWLRAAGDMPTDDSVTTFFTVGRSGRKVPGRRQR